MIETAIIRIRGERFLFRSFDHHFGEQPEAHGKTETPGMILPYLPAGQTTRSAGLFHPSPSVPRSFVHPLHSVAE